MRKQFLRAVSLALAVLCTVSIFVPSVSAASYVTGANSASSSYQSGKYYSNLQAVPLTGDGRNDVLAVALSQLGYQEGNSDGAYSGTVSGSGNFTEFNYNMGKISGSYGGSTYPWCACFVSFCLLQSGCTDQNSTSDWCRKHTGDANYIWREVSCSKWATQLRTCGYFQKSAYKGGSYTPIAGDLIFFTSNGSTESHIGIVLYVSGSTVYTIEGNTSSASGLETNGGGVYLKSYALSSSSITGYGVLPYKEVASVPTIDYSGANITPGLYVASTNKYVYRNQGDANYTWLLPKYSVFTVTEIVSPTLVKGTCTIGGETVTGYIKNNEDRIVQMTSSGSGSTPTPTPTVTLSSIAVTTKPTKTIYNIGESFSKTGMVVTAYYSDGSSKTVTGYTVTGFSSAAMGVKTITVSYSGKTTTFTVTVLPQAKTLSSIAITTRPNKVSYVVGEAFDPKGMVVTAYYSDGSSETVTDYTVSGFSSEALGVKTLTVSYSGKTATLTVAVTSKERVLTAIAVTLKPNKVTYAVGESFDPTGMIVTAYYDDESYEDVTDYTVGGYTSTVGTKRIIVSYGGLTTSFNVTVTERSVTSIAVTAQPNKVTYAQGEELDPTGMVVTATYSDGTTETVTGYTLSGFDATAGTQVITVSYAGKTATFSVTVSSVRLGDANEDGHIDSRDVTMILRYGAGWDVDGFSYEAADVNMDKFVDTRDATYMLRFLAGWAGYEL